MTRTTLRVQIEVTYNGLMLARDEQQRLIASARHYADLRVAVRRGLQALHGREVAFALVVGGLRVPRAERIRALAPPAPQKMQVAVGDTR